MPADLIEGLREASRAPLVAQIGGRENGVTQRELIVVSKGHGIRPLPSGV